MSYTFKSFQGSANQGTRVVSGWRTIQTRARPVIAPATSPVTTETKDVLTTGLTGAAVIATYDPNNPASAGSAQVAMLIGQMINLKYSRDDELEADQLGVCSMNDTGYDPNEMVNVMQILASLDQGGRQPEWFSTHPNPASRITRIQTAIQNINNCPR